MSLANIKQFSKEIGDVFQINPPTPGDPCETTQSFGVNPEMYARIGLPYHNGIDFRAKMKTKVFAPCNCKVTRVENGDANDTTKGRYIYLESAPIMLKDGRIITLEFLYYHLWESLVKVGDEVKAKQLIGLADNTGTFGTGTFSTASHLHFGVYAKQNGQRLNNNYDWCYGALDPEPIINWKDTIMKLYKEADNPAVYQKGADGKFHPIVYERFAKEMYGDWDDIQVDTIAIPDSQKGFPIGFYLN